MRKSWTETASKLDPSHHSLSRTAELPIREATDTYVLATGEAAASRLQILHALYGAGSRRVLFDAGLARGLHVADFGCGVGMVTHFMAEVVAPEGNVTAIDFSADQLAQAKQRLNGQAQYARFVEASATDTRLEAESFDLVYCRFLLLHLPDPRAALREMHRLLKPGGVIVCEDGDLATAGSEPASMLNAFGELFGQLGAKRGVDYSIARHLYQMVIDAGFSFPQITINQPVAVRGENKRLLELTVAEAGPALIDAGLLSKGDLERTLFEMDRANKDQRIVAFMPRMAQVWATK